MDFHCQHTSNKRQVESNIAKKWGPKRRVRLHSKKFTIPKRCFQQWGGCKVVVTMYCTAISKENHSEFSYSHAAIATFESR
jgi:hypothetical protein